MNLPSSPLRVTGLAGIHVFRYLLEQSGFTSSDAEQLARVALQQARRLRLGRPPQAALRSLQTRWYESCARGEPWYDVYSERVYLAEAWACWDAWSSRCLKDVALYNRVPGVGTVLSAIGDHDRVVDLGAGVGMTTAALASMFPTATVTATQLPDTPQWRFLEAVSRHYPIHLASTLERAGGASLVLASEYFEHFEHPVDHLLEVVTALTPRVMLVANAFGATSIGHFDRYRVGAKVLTPSATSRRFNNTLRGCGYSKLKTSLWGGRPAVWIRE